MAYYKRRYYRRKRGYYGSRRYRKSNFARKKARQLRQTDKNRIIVSSQPMFIPANFSKDFNPTGVTGKFTPIQFFNPFYHLLGYTVTDGHGASIPKLKTFDNFCKMFDEFKINAMRVKIQMVSLPPNSNNTACIVRSAIDKNGLSPEFIAQTDKLQLLTFQSYSSFNSKIINNSELYSLYRTFYPIGPFQRGRYLGCSQSYSGEGLKINERNENWTYMPICMVQFYSSDTQDVVQQVTYNVTYDFDITFKGQRNVVTA